MKDLSSSEDKIILSSNYYELDENVFGNRILRIIYKDNTVREAKLILVEVPIED